MPPAIGVVDLDDLAHLVRVRVRVRGNPYPYPYP